MANTQTARVPKEIEEKRERMTLRKRAETTIKAIDQIMGQAKQLMEKSFLLKEEEVLLDILDQIEDWDGIEQLKKYAKLIQETQNIAYPIIERIQDHNEEVMDKKYGSTSEGTRRVARYERWKDFCCCQERKRSHFMEKTYRYVTMTQKTELGARGIGKGVSMGERKRTELPMIEHLRGFVSLQGIVKNFGKAKRREAVTITTSKALSETFLKSNLKRSSKGRTTFYNSWYLWLYARLVWNG